MSRTITVTLYKTIFRPTSTFGSESWTMLQKIERRVQAIEMRYIRKVNGVARKHSIRGEVIGAKNKTNFRNSTPHQWSWFSHLIRIANIRIAKYILETKVQAKNGRGRPRRPWTESLMKY